MSFNPSLDPRMNRLPLKQADETFDKLTEMDNWQTYEVFHQKSRGDQHIHVGIVHAPNAEMAILFAKEQYARRMKCVNLWVVKTQDIVATEYEDEDMFLPSVDKGYREAYFYRTREVIDNYKKQQSGNAEAVVSTEKQSTSDDKNVPKNKPRIILGKKK